MKDPNEIIVDIDLLFPASMVMINQNGINGVDPEKKSVCFSEDGNHGMNKKRKLNEVKSIIVKGAIDLNAIESVEDLEKIGMDKLKAELQVYGMKCGGNLNERAK